MRIAELVLQLERPLADADQRVPRRIATPSSWSRWITRSASSVSSANGATIP